MGLDGGRFGRRAAEKLLQRFGGRTVHLFVFAKGKSSAKLEYFLFKALQHFRLGDVDGFERHTERTGCVGRGSIFEPNTGERVPRSGAEERADSIESGSEDLGVELGAPLGVGFDGPRIFDRRGRIVAAQAGRAEVFPGQMAIHLSSRDGSQPIAEAAAVGAVAK